MGSWWAALTSWSSQILLLKSWGWCHCSRLLCQVTSAESLLCQELSQRGIHTGDFFHVQVHAADLWCHLFWLHQPCRVSWVSGHTLSNLKCMSSLLCIPGLSLKLRERLWSRGKHSPKVGGSERSQGQHSTNGDGNPFADSSESVW